LKEIKRISKRKERTGSGILGKTSQVTDNREDQRQ
jgi:hypothetical protein